MQLLCRNRTTDIEKWRSVFNSHAAAQQAAGLRLQRLWVNADDPNEVFFLFEVDDRQRAQNFMDAPPETEGAAGVIDGDYYVITGLEE